MAVDDLSNMIIRHQRFLVCSDCCTILGILDFRFYADKNIEAFPLIYQHLLSHPLRWSCIEF